MRPRKQHLCAVCGAEQEPRECNYCNGTGTDPDQDVVNGRYVNVACWLCDGTGTGWECPKWDMRHSELAADALAAAMQREEGE